MNDTRPPNRTRRGVDEALKTNEPVAQGYRPRYSRDSVGVALQAEIEQSLAQRKQIGKKRSVVDTWQSQKRRPK